VLAVALLSDVICHRSEGSLTSGPWPACRVPITSVHVLRVQSDALKRHKRPHLPSSGQCSGAQLTPGPRPFHTAALRVCGRDSTSISLKQGPCFHPAFSVLTEKRVL
jgi:hypothetical protein